MGGIRLEWDIEAQQVDKSDSEDPQLKRVRRKNIIRLFLLILILLGLVVGGVFFVQNRLDEVDRQLDQLLRDTVSSEVAAVRVGDISVFMSLQRSATEDWLILQRTAFQNYEYLKANANLQLTGRVVDTEISGQRGRAQVEEIIDGVPYTHVWFYWRYGDGWRHVPPDYTFWGDEKSLERDSITVNYRAVDELFAQQLSEKFSAWLKFACEALACADIPKINIQIITNSPSAMTWLDESSWQLLVQSPYVAGARSDLPFDVPLQIHATTLLSERLFDMVSNKLEPIYPADVYQLRQSVMSWLVGEFVQIDTNSFLIGSLAEKFGPNSVGQLVRSMLPDSNMNIFRQIVGMPLEQAGLDWRDLITWRLVTEDELIARRDEANWLNLYDTSDEAVRTEAYARFNANQPAQRKVAVAQEFQQSASGLPQLKVTVRVGEGTTFRDEIVLFNLINDVWKRAS